MSNVDEGGQTWWTITSVKSKSSAKSLPLLAEAIESESSSSRPLRSSERDESESELYSRARRCLYPMVA